MYNWEGMKKISPDEARRLFLNDKEVYLLYDDNSESLAETMEDIDKHSTHKQEFGVEL